MVALQKRVSGLVLEKKSSSTAHYALLPQNLGRLASSEAACAWKKVFKSEQEEDDDQVDIELRWLPPGVLRPGLKSANAHPTESQHQT